MEGNKINVLEQVDSGLQKQTKIIDENQNH